MENKNLYEVHVGNSRMIKSKKKRDNNKELFDFIEKIEIRYAGKLIERTQIVDLYQELLIELGKIILLKNNDPENYSINLSLCSQGKMPVIILHQPISFVLIGFYEKSILNQ